MGPYTPITATTSGARIAKLTIFISIVSRSCTLAAVGGHQLPLSPARASPPVNRTPVGGRVSSRAIDLARRDDFMRTAGRSGFWIRAAATAIDGIVLLVFAVPVAVTEAVLDARGTLTE